MKRAVLAVGAALAAVLGACLLLATLAAASTPAAQLKVCACKSARRALPLAGERLAGTVYIFAPGVKGARAATLTVDGRRFASIRAGKHGLPAIALATTRLSDGRHTLSVAFKLRGRASATGTAVVEVANHVSAEKLIATALALHGISYGTSLLYRGYAFWHAAVLPRAYRGTGTEADEGVFTEAVHAERRHQLSAAEARALAPLLVRPTAPDSIFARHRARRARRARSASAQCTAPAGWFTKPGANVRVWSQTAGELEPTLAAAEQALGAEQGDMGSPLPDGGGTPAACAEGNIDPLIDIYVMSPTNQIRGGTYLQQEGPNGNGTAFGVTTSTNVSGGKCSAYVALNQSLIASDGGAERLSDVLTHELYHVLQDAHNCEGVASWFTEGSAEWAEIHYGPQNRISQADVGEALDRFQKAQPRSLTDVSEELAPYDDFVWPLFMSQEGVNPARAWEALEGVTTESAATAAIDSVFPFDEYFATFALRDLQIPYDEEGPGDEAEEFQTAATDGVSTLPTTIAESYDDERAEGTTLNGTAEKNEAAPFTIPGSLEARYKTIALPSKQEVDHAVIEFGTLPSEVTAEALVKTASAGKWEHRKMAGDRLEFCRDEQADDIESIIVVLSNHSLESETPQPSEFTYRTATECAAAGLTGTLGITVNNAAEPYVHFEGTINVDHKVNPDGTFDEATTATFAGEISGHGNNDSYKGSYKLNEEPAIAVSDLGTRVELMVRLTALGNTITEGGTANEAACSGGAGVSENAVQFLSGPFTINIPEGSAPQTIQVNDTAAEQMLFSVGTDCTIAPAGEEVRLTGHLTWTPPPPG